RQGLDVDAGPAALVEGAGDAVDIRVVGADIDIEAARAGKGAREHHILEILGVAGDRHRTRDRVLSKRGSRPILRSRDGRLRRRSAARSTARGRWARRGSRRWAEWNR